MRALSNPADPESSTRVPRWRDAAEVRRSTRHESPHRRTRDRDVGGRAQLLKIASWSFLGGVVGGLLGVFGSVQGAWGPRTILLLAALGWGLSFFVPLVASLTSGRVARGLYAPSGRSTPYKQGHSLAESLAARGMYEEAIAAFEAAIAANPGDPTPHLRIARIHRDRLHRYDDAARAFRRGLEAATPSPATATLLRRELVELYVTKMGEPSRAAPVLARMAEEMEGTEAGAWAAAELARIKKRIADAGLR